MKKKNSQTTYFFVDEAGDPVFYNRYGKNIVGNEGCSKILMLGFIRTDDPAILRKGVLEIKNQIENDARF